MLYPIHGLHIQFEIHTLCAQRAAEISRSVHNLGNRIPGCRFSGLEQIDTGNPFYMHDVLKVLRKWLSEIKDQRTREPLLFMFNTRHAHPFIEDVIRWWTDEEIRLGRDILSQALCLIVDSKHAEAVWRVLRERRTDIGQYDLASKLAELPPTLREVRKYLAEVVESEILLNNKPPQISSLDAISKVQDPRIQSWFLKQTNSPIRLG